MRKFLLSLFAAMLIAAPSCKKSSTPNVEKPTTPEGPDYEVITDEAGITRWEIYTEKGLLAFAAEVNGAEDGYDTTNMNLSLNATLKADITLTPAEHFNGINWIPIGTENAGYRGTFDGGGHTISGVVFNDRVSSGIQNYIGLFGYVGDKDETLAGAATIQNVKLENAQIDGFRNVGGIAGGIAHAKIINCAIINCDLDGSNIIGGIVGLSYYSDIIACSNTSDISAFSVIAGGIVGELAVDTSTSTNRSTSRIIACYNTGTVNGNSEVGGIIGYGTSATIISCYNTGTIHSRGGANSGGISGYGNETFISACFNSGEFKFSSFTEANVGLGGIVGTVFFTTNLSDVYWVKDAVAIAEGIQAVGRDMNQYATGTVDESKTSDWINKTEGIKMLNDNLPDDVQFMFIEGDVSPVLLSYSASPVQ